jgi:hypothetical protein
VKLSKLDFLINLGFLLISILFYLTFYFSGHYLLLGDNLIQNFPLRYLVGAIIKSGHLPALDVYNFSGFPLAANFNAGAFFPPTFFFSIVPSLLAFSFNQIIASFLAASGTYFLLRKYNLNLLSCSVGSFIYTCSGQMASQIAHIDIIQAASFFPWTLLALEYMSDFVLSAKLKQSLITSMIFALLGALIILSGSTRESTDFAIIVFLRIIYFLIQKGRQSYQTPIKELLASKTARQYLSFVAFGLIIAAGLSAAQLLPGAAALAQSQRFRVSPQFFTESSGPFLWLVTLINPVILGTSGSFGSPGFFGVATIPSFSELDGYMTFFSVLSFAYFLQPKNKIKDKQSWINFYVLLTLVGIFLAFGATTFPFEEFLYHIPMYGKQRIQARNIIITDLGLAVLCGAYLNKLTFNNTEIKQTPSRSVNGMFIFTILLNLVDLIYPKFLLSILNIGKYSTTGSSGLRPWIAVLLIIEILTYLFIYKINLKLKFRKALILLVIALDILFYNFATVANVFEQSNVSGPNTTSLAVSEFKSHTNRDNYIKDLNKTLIWDPHLINNNLLPNIGWPDLNILINKLSAQGYASLANSNYQRATYSHANLIFAPAIAQNNIINELGVTTLYCSNDAFITQSPVPFIPPNTPIYELAVPPKQSSPAFFYIGNNIKVSSIIFRLQNLKTFQKQHPSFYAITQNHKKIALTSYSIEKNSFLRINVTPASNIVAIYSLLSYKELGIISQSGQIITSSNSLYYLNGPLENAVKMPQFIYQTVKDGLTVFKNADAYPMVKTTTGATLTSFPKLSIWGQLSFKIYARKTSDVEVSLANIAGWRVNLTFQKKSFSLPINPKDLMISFKVPPGSYSVTLNYLPPSLIAGIWISLIFLAAWITIISLLTLSCLGERKKTMTGHYTKDQMSKDLE